MHVQVHVNVHVHVHVRVCVYVHARVCKFMRVECLHTAREIVHAYVYACYRRYGSVRWVNYLGCTWIRVP